MHEPKTISPGREISTPKRKRTISDPSVPIIPFAPELNLRLRTPSPTRDDTLRVPDSPRTVVARSLEDMSIQRLTPSVVFGSITTTPAPLVTQDIKRVKITEVPETPQAVRSNEGKEGEEGVTTRDWAHAFPSPPKAMPVQRCFDAVRGTSSPTVTSSNKSFANGTVISRTERTDSPLSDTDPSDLFFQDSEITGHLVDPSTDPDDDGYGINGIGFKPTPTIAWHRTQKRRQQILEWKAREARDARMRRARARLGGGDVIAVGGSERRSVRFA